MSSKAGLSGAQVLLVDDDAVKVAYDVNNRVVEQGEWLERNDGKHLPVVKKVLPRGYVMERLDPIATWRVELSLVVDALTESVWAYAPTSHVDTSQTLLKVTNILERHAPELIGPAVDVLAYIRKTEDCLTHGDPTAENVMLRDGQYVIIDPIPSTEAVPDDLAVDVGKLLQSAHGWEAMKGEERSAWTPGDVELHFEHEVFEVGELWCIVHFVRTLPYVPEEVKPHVLAKLRELLGT